MKALLDFLPIVLFFGAYKLYGIYPATAVLMVATTAQMAIVYAIDKKLSAMHKATLALILIFGTLTLVLQDERFIKWKPTVLYTAMAVALAVALWGFRKNFLKIMLGSQLNLPDPVWNRLTVAWMLYCLFMAAINGYVAAYWTSCGATSSPSPSLSARAFTWRATCRTTRRPPTPTNRPGAQDDRARHALGRPHGRHLARRAGAHRS